MKREDIEKAAGNYSGSILGFRDNKLVMDKHKAFADGVEWFRKSLFHKTKDEVPQPIGKYKNDAYPQIPCLVKGYLCTGYGYGVRYWNVEYQVWDDEGGDDYECDKESVEVWAYLDDIIGNMED